MHGIVIDHTYIKKENESAQLRMGGGCWTINLGEISGKQIDTLQIITNKYTYIISYNNALKKGFIRNFQGEIKLIVPIISWEVVKNE